MNLFTSGGVCENWYPAFPSTSYINKLELASLKKMIAGKLWVDSRKFVSRQNLVVINGLFTLFGATLGKSASEIRAETCDHLLDPDNKSPTRHAES